MCIVRPRSSMNCRSGRRTTPSITACRLPVPTVLLDLRIGERRNVGTLLIAAIPRHRLADRIGVVPGRAPLQVMVGTVAIELQPVVLVRRVGVALDRHLAA